MQETIRVAGRPVEQSAFAWDPIEILLSATSPVKEG
jgi:hypothetical protein